MDEIKLQDESGDAIVVLSGEVTVENAPRLKEAVAEAIREGSPLVIRAADLSRLDAAGVQILVAGARAAKRSLFRGAASAAWLTAFSRYAVGDPFTHESIR